MNEAEQAFDLLRAFVEALQSLDVDRTRLITLRREYDSTHEIENDDTRRVFDYLADLAVDLSK